MAKIGSKSFPCCRYVVIKEKTQMINSVSGSAAVSQQYLQNQQAAKPPAKSKETDKPDTVELSKQGTQAAGDVDHDGDSH
jgi:hypothetical protein